MKKFLDFIGKSIKDLVYIAIIIGCFVAMIVKENDHNKLKNEYEYTLSEYEQLLFKEKEQNLYTFIGEYSFLKNEKIPTNDSVVYEFIKATGCWYPDIVMAQYVIESRRGKSELSQQYNNCFGMTLISPKGRPTLQLPNQKAVYNDIAYGIYNNWQSSILDRIILDHIKFPTGKPDRDLYEYIIGNFYAEDTSYHDKITTIAKKWRFK